MGRRCILMASAIRSLLAVVAVGCGCTDRTVSDAAEGSGGGSAASATAADTEDPSAEGAPVPDVSASSGASGDPPCVGWCEWQIDVLVVIDNSSSMAEEQRALALAAPRLLEAVTELLDASGNVQPADVHLMVTTTDVGNPLCTPFQPPGYVPANGAPTTTGCNARIDDFTSVDASMSAPDACTDACPTDIVAADAFIAYDANTGTTNVPTAPPRDVDGDGTPDAAEAQALACLLPQGIDGCGYESPLEAMLQALDPSAPWNGDGGFLRPGALLAIVLVTDESDCSIADVSVMEDPTYQEVDPATGSKRASSAICWNAGMSCGSADAQGVYAECAPTDDGALHPLSRYTDLLVAEIRERQGKRVVMQAIVGVPPVTEYNPLPPFEPIAGGEFALQYRDWREGMYPDGDILPDDAAAGVTAERRQFELGIGPACTGTDAAGAFTGQAVPNTRVTSVCHALDTTGDSGEPLPQCCIDSICEPSGAFNCLRGVIYSPIDSGFPPGG